MNPAQFLDLHRESWKALEKFESKIRQDGWKTLSKDDIWRLATLYRRTSAHLAMARAYLPGNVVTSYLNQLVARTYNLFYKARSWSRLSVASFFSTTFPQSMRKNAFRITIAAAIMATACLLGFLVTLSQPQVAGIFLSDETIDHVKKGKLWTEGMFNVAPSSVIATGIFCNNISVSFSAFAFGLFFGVGTVYFLFLNGLMLGSLFAFTMHYGKGFALLSFIVGHGFLELTLICVAAAAGFNLAHAELFPGSRSRSLAFKQEGLEGTYLVLGSIPFFILAGIVEGFVSPNKEIPFSIKLTIGLLLLASYLAYAFGYRGKPARRKQVSISQLIDEVEHPAGLLQSRNKHSLTIAHK